MGYKVVRIFMKDLQSTDIWDLNIKLNRKSLRVDQLQPHWDNLSNRCITQISLLLTPNQTFILFPEDLALKI